MARNNQRGRAKPHKRTGAINSKETGHAGAERSERPAQTPAAQERPKSPGKSPHRSAQEQGRTRSQRSSRERMRGQNSTRGHTSHDTGKREPAASRAASTQAQDKSHPRKKPDTAAERPRRSEAIDPPRPKRSTNRGEKHGSALMEPVGGFLHRHQARMLEVDGIKLQIIQHGTASKVYKLTHADTDAEPDEMTLPAGYIDMGYGEPV